MNLGKKDRSTSASGKLETQNVPSISNELGCGVANDQQPWGTPTWPDAPRKKGPLDGQATFQPQDPDGKGCYPEWLEREILKLGHRSHSVDLGDVTSLTDRQHCSMDSMRSLYEQKPSELKNWLIEQKVSLENLTNLKMAFEELENDGRKSLDVTNFKRIVKNCLGLHGVRCLLEYYNDQIQELFMKIDYLGNGQIKWDQFCTFMQLEYTEKDESLSRSKSLAFTLPASVVTMSHSQPVLRILCNQDSTVITIRENGEVSYWSPELQIRKSKVVFQERPVNQKSKWATDFVIMPQYNKLIVGTGDREIQLYEISSLEPYCQVSALETVPLTMDYCYTGHDECVILFGDALGCVNIMIMTLVGETLRTWKKLPKVEKMPSVALDQALLSPAVKLIQWKVHEDWVNEVKYFKSIHAIISTSSHEHTALVIGCMIPMSNLKERKTWEGKTKKAGPSPGIPQQRIAWDHTVFSIYKGVKTFDFSHKHRLLITGGLDRLIRMWNPYMPSKPTGILKGHSAPIFYLCIPPEDSRIFSVSMDNTVKIWDIHDQRCMFTAHPKASLLRGDLTACMYVQSIRSLYVGTDSMARLSLQTRPLLPSRLVVSHREPVLCCRYSEVFRQVVSGSEGSVVKVWDIDTGMQVFEFGGAHGLSAVACMTIDPKGRRLVTGGRDGCLKVWNFNNGHCLKIFKKEGEDDEVCDCTYLTVNRKSYVVSVGWGRRVNVYIDSPDDDLHHIQNPQPPWPDDLRHGHQDDILCVAECPPSLLASGSHDGEVIVWNLVSGHLQCRFLTPLPPDQGTGPFYVDRSVLSIIFLRSRTMNVKHTTAACLVSSGHRGYLNFWNIQTGGKFLASFEASKMKRKVTKLVAAREDTLLYVADEVGYIYVFDIKAYALGPEPEDKGPKMVNYWRAHISTITSLQAVDSDRVLLTASTDCTVRLWSIHGEFIGTFGQSESWSVHTPASWKHPAVPYEILIDSLSMPTHPVLEKYSLDTRTKAREDDLNADAHSKLRYHPLTITDRDIEEEINSLSYPLEPGKRLRHEIFKHTTKLPSHRGPKVYQSLKYFELGDAPTTCMRPDLSLAGIDPFISSSAEELPEESQ
ncbi:WD repeat-containing protein 49 [Scleropages formosus]|uniref:WD repeat-containing protein 49 n=1 Tax=Scleropages formosus TaxID=113540 RepID=UPI0010FA860D|nr:WD repeat-containing protein 49-like [Scleropages formosus]